MEGQVNPMSEVDLTESLRSPGAFDGSVLEVMQAARAKLVEIEMDLRDLWYDSAEQAPVLAAQVSTAAGFAHHAAEALWEAPRLYDHDRSSATSRAGVPPVRLPLHYA